MPREAVQGCCLACKALFVAVRQAASPTFALALPSPCAVLGEGAAAAAAPPPLPVFRSACWLTNKLLGNLSLVPRLVALFGLQRGRRPAEPALSDTTSMASMSR